MRDLQIEFLRTAIAAEVDRQELPVCSTKRGNWELTKDVTVTVPRAYVPLTNGERSEAFVPGFRGGVCPIEFAVTFCAAKIEARQWLLGANLNRRKSR